MRPADCSTRPRNPQPAWKTNCCGASPPGCITTISRNWPVCAVPALTRLLARRNQRAVDAASPHPAPAAGWPRWVCPQRWVPGAASTPEHIAARPDQRCCPLWTSFCPTSCRALGTTWISGWERPGVAAQGSAPRPTRAIDRSSDECLRWSEPDFIEQRPGCGMPVDTSALARTGGGGHAVGTGITSRTQVEFGIIRWGDRRSIPRIPIRRPGTRPTELEGDRPHVPYQKPVCAVAAETHLDVHVTPAQVRGADSLGDASENLSDLIGPRQRNSSIDPIRSFPHRSRNATCVYVHRTHDRFSRQRERLAGRRDRRPAAPGHGRPARHRESVLDEARPVSFDGDRTRIHQLRPWRRDRLRRWAGQVPRWGRHSGLVRPRGRW